MGVGDVFALFKRMESYCSIALLISSRRLQADLLRLLSTYKGSVWGVGGAVFPLPQMTTCDNPCFVFALFGFPEYERALRTVQTFASGGQEGKGSPSIASLFVIERVLHSDCVYYPLAWSIFTESSSRHDRLS